MKTIKQIGFIAIAIITIALIGCGGNDNPPPKECTCNPKDHLQAGETCNCGDDNCNCTVEQPKSQTATIHPFEDLELTVTGTFTNSEWAGVAGKIETAIREHFDATPSTPPEIKAALKARYAECEAIIVEKTSEYTTWKTNGDGKTIYLNYNIVQNLTKDIIGAARGSMNNNKAETVYPCCPNGLHLVGETCCNSSNCNCEKNVAGQRVEGIAVTNRDNVANFNTMVTSVTDAISWFTTTQQTYIKNNIKEIKIVVGTTAINPPSNGVLTVNNDRLDADIWQALDDWCTANSIE